jgi:glycosyltransferase involved in cell wall biosynthesis
MNNAVHPTTPPFSVIMPVYRGDAPAHVVEALDSIYTQSLKADEVVVIQDGPVPAELKAVLDRYRVEHTEVKLVVLEENQGLSGALNAGIKAASNEWLARMDADDICLPSRFEKQLTYLAAHPELALLGSWITEYDEHMEQEIGLRTLPAEHSQILAYARWRCPFNHMTVVYRKSALEALGMYKSYGAVGDDYELWARFLMNGYTTANIQESLVKARTGTDFFSNRRRGLRYFKNELREINDLYKLGLLNAGHYLVHFVVKALVRLAPTPLVKWFYKGLRKTH